MGRPKGSKNQPTKSVCKTDEDLMWEMNVAEIVNKINMYFEHLKDRIWRLEEEINSKEEVINEVVRKRLMYVI